jgi:hypothetical protein
MLQDVEGDKLLLLRVSSGAPRLPGPLDQSLGLHLPSLPAAGALFSAQPRGQGPREVSSRTPFIPVESLQVCISLLWQLT